MPETHNPPSDRREVYAQAIRGAGDTAYGNTPFYEAITDAVIAIADTEQAELRRERDLAVAHDRQPYPTAWAYEQACKALRQKADALDRVRSVLESEAVVGRSALEYRGLITSALMADEAQPASSALLAVRLPAVEGLCPGFPDNCANPVQVPPMTPYHGGGIRCGCADEGATS